MDSREQLIKLLERKARLAKLTERERQTFDQIEAAYRAETVCDANGLGVRILHSKTRRRLLEQDPENWPNNPEWQEFLRLEEEISKYRDELRGHTEEQKLPFGSTAWREWMMAHGQEWDIAERLKQIRKAKYPELRVEFVEPGGKVVRAMEHCGEKYVDVGVQTEPKAAPKPEVVAPKPVEAPRPEPPPEPRTAPRTTLGPQTGRQREYIPTPKSVWT